MQEIPQSDLDQHEWLPFQFPKFLYKTPGPHPRAPIFHHSISTSTFVPK